MAGGATVSGEGTKSTLKIMANIFISFIGSGVLGLPYAFKEAGILEGVLVITFVAVVSVKAMLLVIDCKYALIGNAQEKKQDKVGRASAEEMEDLLGDGLASSSLIDEPMAKPGEELSYGDVGYYAFGEFGRRLVDWAIILSQTGFCCAYLLFISANLSNYFPNVKQNYWFLILLPLEFCLCLIRNLKRLAVTSLFAQVSNLMAFGVVFWFDFEEFHPITKANTPKEFSIEGLPFFLCIAIYCYEGAGMILSLEASLHSDIRHRFKLLFLITISIVTVLYAVFGSCGYLSFGKETQDIITLNLPRPENGALDFAMLVTSCLCLSLLFTFPVMMFPVAAILERILSLNLQSPMWKLMTLRLVLVLATGGLALAIPDFGSLMAIIGATCCIWLAFILPAVFHMRICARTLTPLQRIIDYVIILLGVVGTIVGMVDAIQRMSGDINSTTKEVNTQTYINTTIFDEMTTPALTLPTIETTSNLTITNTTAT